MLVWNTFENDARVLKEAETLQAAGWQVTVFALHTPGETRRSEIVGNGVQVVRVLRSPGLWLRRRWRNPTSDASRANGMPNGPSKRGLIGNAKLVASRLITHVALLIRLIHSRPQIVHGHDVNVALTAWIAARVSRARFVFDAHEISTSREGYRSVRNLVAAIEKRLMPRADLVITTTRMRARYFSRAYKIPRPLVLQNWPRYKEPGPGNRLRVELRLDSAWPIVLYQGGLQQGRGLEQLVRAAAQVEAAYFVFIGGGRMEGKLKSMVAELGIEERVRFVPTVPVLELHSFTASADIGVQPLENTCFNHFSTDSNKLFEYIQAGLPVVVSRLPEMKLVVERHGVGLLVEQGNVDQLVAAIKSLANDPVQRQEIRKRAYLAARELCWEAQERLLIESYQRLSEE